MAGSSGNNTAAARPPEHYGSWSLVITSYLTMCPSLTSPTVSSAAGMLGLVLSSVTSNLTTFSPSTCGYYQSELSIGRQLVITGAMMVSRSSSGARAGVGGASVTSPMWMPRMSTSLTIWREFCKHSNNTNVLPVELDQCIPAAQD